MQQNIPNFIHIDNKIINLNNVNSIEKYSEHEDGSGRFRLIINFETYKVSFLGDEAKAAYDSLKGFCYVYNTKTDNATGETNFIPPNWTQQHIIGIEHKLSGSGNPTWYLVLETGQTLYVRQSNKAMWLEHYPQLEQMGIGDFISKTDVDITCYTMPDSEKPEFLRTMKVVPGGKLELPELSASAKRKAEVAKALQGFEQWAYLDLETTGIEADDEIMQIGLIHPSGEQGQILNQRDCFVKPLDAQKVYRVQKNNKSAYNIHGISPTQVEGAKTFPEHYNMLREAIHGKTLATCSEFDLKMLNQVCAMHNLDPIEPAQHIDLIKLFAKYIGVPGFKAGEYKWQSLEDAYKHILGKDLEGAHAAITDAQAMREIVETIIQFESDQPF